MIIGYNFFGKELHGTVFDTAIPTSDLDEVVVGTGIYDEIFISVDTKINDENKKPEYWQIKTIMDSKFNNNLEAGSINADGHIVTRIQIYRRRIDDDGKWLLLGDFPYDFNFNVYSFVDRLAENGAVYEYAIVPIANEVLGDRTVSQPIMVDYKGVWVSDLENSFQLEYDFVMDEVHHQRNMSTQETLDGRYPVITFGAQNYKTGSLSFLPLSEEQVKSGGTKINSKNERLAREAVLNFLNRPGAKVIRNDNGSMMVVATHDVSESPRDGNLIDISDIKFSYTQIGDFDFDTMSKGGLVGEAVKSRYSFDENGEVVWSMASLSSLDSSQGEIRPRNTFGGQ